MPDTTTAVLALIKPEVGASRDSWGSKTNLNWDTLDTYVSQAAPIGMIADFAGPNAPSGWLIADGRLISRTTYSNLFAVIGTTWGSGDGSTTFALPSLNGRSTVGPGTVIDQIGTSTTFTLGQQFGMVYNYISQAYLPAYNLVTDYQGVHSHGGATASNAPLNSVSDMQGVHSHGGQTNNNSADHYHTAITDAQGSHSHNVTAFSMASVTTRYAGGSNGGTDQNLVTDVQGLHQHNVTTGGASTPHVHQIFADGGHQHNVTITAHTHGITADGGHQHNVNLGGGGNPFEVMSPILVVTKIIYCGSQASTRASLDTASPSSLEGGDELAAIREELAALRAILAPPGRRVMSSPMRGTH